MGRPSRRKPRGFGWFTIPPRRGAVRRPSGSSASLPSSRLLPAARSDEIRHGAGRSPGTSGASIVIRWPFGTFTEMRLLLEEFVKSVRDCLLVGLSVAIEEVLDIAAQECDSICRVLELLGRESPDISKCDPLVGLDVGCPLGITPDAFDVHWLPSRRGAHCWPRQALSHLIGGQRLASLTEIPRNQTPALDLLLEPAHFAAQVQDGLSTSAVQSVGANLIGVIFGALAPVPGRIATVRATFATVGTAALALGCRAGERPNRSSIPSEAKWIDKMQRHANSSVLVASRHPCLNGLAPSQPGRRRAC